MGNPVSVTYKTFCYLLDLTDDQKSLNGTFIGNQKKASSQKNPFKCPKIKTILISGRALYVGEL